MGLRGLGNNLGINDATATKNRGRLITTQSKPTWFPDRIASRFYVNQLTIGLVVTGFLLFGRLFSFLVIVRLFLFIRFFGL